MSSAPERPSVCTRALQMQTLFWVNAPKQMKTVTYIFLGWAVLPYAGEMRTALGSTVRLPASAVTMAVCLACV